MESSFGRRHIDRVRAICQRVALSLLALSLVAPAFASPDEEMPQSDLWWWERAAHAVLAWWSGSDTVLPPIVLPPIERPSDPAVAPAEPPIAPPDLAELAAVAPPAAVDDVLPPPARAMGSVQITAGGFVAAEVACAEAGYRERTLFEDKRSVSVPFSDGCVLQLEGARALTLRGLSPGLRLVCDARAGMCSADGQLP